MAIAMTCQHCGTKNIETANDVWYIKGFILFSTHGSKSIMGCNDCVRSKTLQALAVSSVMGWWCFPWGLGTPFVIVQNLVAWSDTKNNRPLRKLLAQNEMDYDDLEIGEDGMSNGDRRLVNATLGALHRMVWADGDADEREIETGATILAQMLGEDLLPEQRAREVLASAEPPPAGDLSNLSPDGQIVLMKAACAVAAADGIIEPGEIDTLRRIGRQLNLHPDLTERFITALGEAGEKRPDVRADAARMLGIPVDAPVGMVGNAYRSRCMEATHAFEDDDDRAASLVALAGAYEVLVGAPPDGAVA